MANNYEQSEINRRATEYVAQGMSPPEALAKARAEIEAIMNLPEEGLQGALTGDALAAHMAENPMDFVPDNVKRFVDPNDPLYPNGGFMQWLQQQEEEKRRMRMLNNPVTNTNPMFMGYPSLMNMK